MSWSCGLRGRTPAGCHEGGLRGVAIRSQPGLRSRKGGRGGDVVHAASDIHKRRFQAARWESEGGQVSEQRFEACRRGAAASGYASGRSVAAVAFEAISGWRWVWRELTALDFDVCLADPGEVTALRGTSKRAKTDGSMLVGWWCCSRRSSCPSRGCRRRRSRSCATRHRYARRSPSTARGGRSVLCSMRVALRARKAADGGGQTLGKRPRARGGEAAHSLTPLAAIRQS